MLCSPYGDLRARSKAEFAQNAFEVYLDGALCNYQLMRDCAITHPLRHKSRDLFLSSSER